MQRRTKQKEHIRSALDSLRRPLSPAEIFEFARSSCPTISIATVYREIARLLEQGEVAKVSLPGAADRYETKECASHHHHHFHCDDCGRVFDIEGCSEERHMHLPAGFEVARHEVTYYGNCRDCRERVEVPSKR